MRIVVAVLALMSAFIVDKSFAYTFSDNFISPTLNSLWSIGVSGGNTITLDTINQRIVQTQNGSSGSSGLSFASPVLLSGQFTASVDFSILTPRPVALNNGNQERIGFGLAGPGGYLGAAQRISDGYFGQWSATGGGEVYLSDMQNLGLGIHPWPGISAFDSVNQSAILSGTLMWERDAANTLSAFFSDALHSKTLLYAYSGITQGIDSLGLSIWNGYADQTGMQIAFDNFNLATPNGPVNPGVPEPATMLLTATGALAAAYLRKKRGATLR